MSVYSREYRVYSGALTPPWRRIEVLARYGMTEIWSSRIATGLFTLAALPVLLALFAIYLGNNPALRMLILRREGPVVSLDSAFFLRTLEIQCWIGLVIAAWVAPRLVSHDLRDNGLAILLSRPVSPLGYVLGKGIALSLSLALVTSLPCLLLFAYQAYSAGASWTLAHLPIAAGLLAGTLLWIAILALGSLAVSSWVRSRFVATGAIFAAVAIPAGVGGVVTAILRTRWGLLINLPVLMTEIWRRLLGAPGPSPFGELPAPAIALMLAFLLLIPAAVLRRTIRAREEVRG